MSSIITAFNDHFIEFVDDIINIFPNDHDVLTAKKAFTLMRKANPKMIIKIWKTFVVGKYINEINAGDIGFFMNKDYGEDIKNANTDNTDKIMESINRLREPIKQMSIENQKKTIKYIQNLTKLSSMYNE